MKKIIVILSVVLFTACKTEKPSSFPEAALNETFLALDEKPITFKEIIEKYKGKKILIESCASWCEECILGLPHVNKLMEKYPDVVFLFLSIDKTIPQWKKGIERFNMKGEHYFLESALKGGYAKSLGIQKIPNYMVVNERGIVSLANVAEATDPRLDEALNAK